MSNTGLSRMDSEQLAQESNDLLTAIMNKSVSEVRKALANVRSPQRVVLTAPSLVADQEQSTPFMAAVKRGDLPIFTALQHHFDRLFSGNVRAGH